MKLLKWIFITVICSIGFLGLYAQDIHLTSGNKIKIIEVGRYIQVVMPPVNLGEDSLCSNNVVSGEFISYSDGKLKLRVVESIEPLMVENENAGYIIKKYKSKDNQLFLDIPNEAILAIIQKGNKKVRERPVMDVMGAVLIMFGIAHLTSAPIAEVTETDGGDILLRLGFAELITGIAFVSIFHQKTYITSDYCPDKKAGAKVWKLD